MGQLNPTIRSSVRQFGGLSVDAQNWTEVYRYVNVPGMGYGVDLDSNGRRLEGSANRQDAVRIRCWVDASLGTNLRE